MMKICGWLVLLFFPLLSFAQFKAGVQARTNYATPHLSKKTSFNAVKSGVGWQACASAAYQVHKWFVYSGLSLAQYRFSVGSKSEFDQHWYTYHPLYLQLPVGIGYKLPLHKTRSLMLHGGVQGQLGVSGKLQEPHVVICVTVPCLQPTDRFTRDIKFGKGGDANSYEGFARTAATLQAGAAVDITERLAAGVSYTWSVTNAQDFGDYGGTTRLRMWDVSVTYYLVH